MKPLLWPLLLVPLAACNGAGSTSSGGCAFSTLPASDCSPVDYIRVFQQH